MRNGFLYKPFTLKQINSVNIRPTPQEKNEWLDIYNKYCDDPTDKENFHQAIKKNSANEISKGEKIYVESGELVSVYGVVQDFDKDG